MLTRKIIYCTVCLMFIGNFSISVNASDSIFFYLFCTPTYGSAELYEGDQIEIYDPNEESEIISSFNYSSSGSSGGWGGIEPNDTAVISSPDLGTTWGMNFSFKVRKQDNNCLSTKVDYTTYDTIIDGRHNVFITSLQAEDHIINLPKHSSCPEGEPIEITSDIPGDNFSIISQSGIDIQNGKYIVPQTSISGTYNITLESDYCLNEYSASFEIFEKPQDEFTYIEKCEKLYTEPSYLDISIGLNSSEASYEFIASITSDTIINYNITNHQGCLSKKVIDVKVIKPKFLSLKYQKQEADCWEEGKINIESFDIKNMLGEPNIHLRNSLTNQVYTDISLVPEGIYRFEATDDTYCLAEYEEEITVLQKCLEDYPVFTPNGDNIEDDYFIPHEGEVTIYNRDGVVIRKLTTPAYWDGRNDSGNLQPMGIYLLVTETGKKVNITLVR